MIELRTVAAVAVGAALGGIVRFLVAQWVIGRFGPGTGPYATLFINVSGSFLIGIVLEVALTRSGLDSLWRPFLATGILGGYTTFSTFSYEALAYWSAGEMTPALLYVGGSVLLGIFACAGGITVARTFAQ